MHQQGKAMARRFEKAKSHLLALPLLFSAVLSGAIVLDGNTIMRGDLAGGIEENYISSFTLQDGVLWLFLTVVLYILLLGLTGIYKKYSALFFDKKEKTDHPARLFLVVFLIFLVAWLPYVLTYFPGAVFADAFDSIWQGTVNAYSNHHPVLYTLWVKLCMEIGNALQGTVSAGVFVYTVSQTICMAAVMAYFVLWLRQKGVNGFYCGVVSAFIAIFPLFPYYAVAMWKDTYFALALFLFALYHIDMVCSQMEILRSRKGLFRYFVLAFLIVFLRNNGLYVCVFSALAMLLIFHKKGLKFFGRYLVAEIAFLVMVVVVQGPIFSLFVVPTEKVESLSIPNQQIFAVFADENGVYDQEDIDFISQIWDVDEMQQKYTPCLADTPKWYMDRFDQTFLNEHVGEYLKFWVTLGLKNPLIYVRAWLMETLCFWSPTRDGYTAYVQHGVWANNIGLVQTNLWYNWFGWDFSQLVYPRYCISSGFFFWVYMFSTMVGYSAVPKKQRFKALLPAMPTIGLWLTIMIATPVASSLRYVYVLVLLTPLLVVFPALMRRKLADAPDHKPE